MLSLLAPVLLAGSLLGQTPPSVSHSYQPAPGPLGQTSLPPSFLYQPAHIVDDVLRCPAVAYVPQPGDIMLATDPGRFWTITHNLAFAGEPHNSGIVVALPDGSLGVLEAGPDDCLHVEISDLLTHLKHYEE